MTFGQRIGNYLVTTLTAISLGGGLAYAQGAREGLPGEEPKPKGGEKTSTSTPKPASDCTTCPQPRKGPSKAFRDLQAKVNQLDQKYAQQLTDTLQRAEGLDKVVRTDLQNQIGDLVKRLEGYETLKQAVEGLTPLSNVVREAYQSLTRQHDGMLKTCTASYAAQERLAENEKEYHKRVGALDEKIIALKDDKSLDDRQRTEQAVKLREQIAKEKSDFHSYDRKAKELSARCTGSKQDYDAAEAELKERMARNLTRAGRLLLEVGESYLNNDGVHQAMTTARLGYEGKKLRFWGEAGTLYGQAQQQTSSLSTLPQTTVVGPGHQDVTWQEGTMTEETRYHTALALGVEKGWLVGKRKRVELSLGARAAAYLGERTTTNEVMNYSQLRDLNGNDVGQLLSAAGRTVEREALHDLVLGLEAGVSRLFWDRYAASLRLSPQYNVSKETFVPALTLGLGARF